MTLAAHRADRPRWILALSLAWVTAWLWFTWPYWEDDAYIHLEYARSLAEGHGFSFNNRLSNGDTAPLWVLWLAWPMQLGMPGLWAGKLLALLCCATTLAVLWQFARRLQHDLKLDHSDPAAWSLALFVSSPYFCYWAFSGMEAVTAAGWLMLQACLLMPRQASVRTLLAASACLGLGPLLRPEFTLMCLAGGPFLVWQGWQVLRGRPAAQALAIALACVLALSLPVLLWASYAMQAFGHVLPNTNAAKQAPPGTWVTLRLLQVTALGFPGLFLLGLLLLARWRGWQGWRGVPRTAWPLLAWAALVACFYMLNHTHVQTRYVLVLAPGLLAVTCAMLARRVSPAVLTGSATASVLLGACVSLVLVVPHMRNKVELIASTARMAAHIEATVPRSEPIAVYAIGQFGHLLRHHELVDVGGITRPAASRFLYDEAARVAWARQEGARYFIWGEAPEPGAVLVQSFEAHNVGWFMNPAAYAQSAPVRLWRLPTTPPQ